MRKIIGLTGPTGAGKSSLHAAARGMGVKVIDCDKVAREVADSGALFPALCEEFGDDIVKDGALDRRLLASRAFASPHNTERLNAIMLPAIAARIKEMLGDGDVLLDAPTLFESGLDKICDKVICVLASRENRKTRIIQRDRLSKQQAEERLSAAKSDEYFSSRADHILYNDGDREDFIKTAKSLLSKITEEN